VCSAKRAFRAGSDGDGVGDRAARVEQGHLVAGPKGERLAALDRPGHPLAVGVSHVGDAAYGDALPRLNLDGLVDRDPRRAGIYLRGLRVQHLQREALKVYRPRAAVQYGDVLDAATALGELQLLQLDVYVARVVLHLDGREVVERLAGHRLWGVALAEVRLAEVRDHVLVPARREHRNEGRELTPSCAARVPYWPDSSPLLLSVLPGWPMS
jgi:hypothetical protein